MIDRAGIAEPDSQGRDAPARDIAADWRWAYIALYAFYFVVGMAARLLGWVGGDAPIFVNAARRVLDGSFDMYSLIVNPASAPPLGTGYTYSPLMAIIISPFVGLADIMGWGQPGAERLMALPLLVADILAMQQMRRLIRTWRPGADERFIFIGILIALCLTGFWIATALGGHDEGLLLLFLLLTLRLTPQNVLLGGLCAGLTLAAKQTSLLEILPIGLVLLFSALQSPSKSSTDPHHIATRKRLQDALAWGLIAVGVFAAFMLPPLLRNAEAVFYAMVTAMSRLALYGQGLPVWIDRAAQATMTPSDHQRIHDFLVTNSNSILITIVALTSLVVVWRAWTLGRPIGTQDTRLLALVAFGASAQIVFGKWIGGHYYALPLALVFLWDLARTSPPNNLVNATSRLQWFPLVGLGASVLMRSVTTFGPGPGLLKDALLLGIFAVLLVLTLRSALNLASPSPHQQSRLATEP